MSTWLTSLWIYHHEQFVLGLQILTSFLILGINITTKQSCVLAPSPRHFLMRTADHYDILPRSQMYFVQFHYWLDQSVSKRDTQHPLLQFHLKLKMFYVSFRVLLFSSQDFSHDSCSFLWQTLHIELISLNTTQFAKVSFPFLNVLSCRVGLQPCHPLPRDSEWDLKRTGIFTSVLNHHY